MTGTAIIAICLLEILWTKKSQFPDFTELWPNDKHFLILPISTILEHTHLTIMGWIP